MCTHACTHTHKQALLVMVMLALVNLCAMPSCSAAHVHSMGRFKALLKKKVTLLSSGGQASYKSNLREKKQKSISTCWLFFFFWPEKKIEISFNSILKQDYRNLKVTTWLSSLTQWWTSVLTDHDLVLTNVVSAQPEGITTRCLQYPKFPPWSLMFI